MTEFFFSSPPKIFSYNGSLGALFSQLALSRRGLDVDHKIGVDLLLVLQSMSSPLHVHLLCVRVVELAVAELAVKAERKLLKMQQILRFDFNH